MNQDGDVNFAPMGVVWGEDRLTIRPYRDTTTFRKRVATGRAVVNLVDDVYYCAQGAISSPVCPAGRAGQARGGVRAAARAGRRPSTPGPRAASGAGPGSPSGRAGTRPPSAPAWRPGRRW